MASSTIKKETPISWTITADGIKTKAQIIAELKALKTGDDTCYASILWGDTKFTLGTTGIYYYFRNWGSDLKSAFIMLNSSTYYDYDISGGAITRTETSNNIVPADTKITLFL